MVYYHHQASFIIITTSTHSIVLCYFHILHYSSNKNMKITQEIPDSLFQTIWRVVTMKQPPRSINNEIISLEIPMYFLYEYHHITYIYIYECEILGSESNMSCVHLTLYSGLSVTFQFDNKWYLCGTGAVKYLPRKMLDFLRKAWSFPC